MSLLQKKAVVCLCVLQKMHATDPLRSFVSFIKIKITLKVPKLLLSGFCSCCEIRHLLKFSLKNFSLFANQILCCNSFHFRKHSKLCFQVLLDVELFSIF